jgi:hypothetical protein
MATLNKNKQVEFSGEALPQVGSEAYKQAQSGIVPTSSYTTPTTGNSTITSSSMIDEKPVVLPETKPSTTSSSVIETVTTGNTLDRAKTAEETKRANEIEKLNTEKAGYETGLKNILGEQATMGERKSQLLTDSKIPELRKQSDEITNQIEAKQLALRRQIEDLQKNPQGLFGGGLQQEVDRINREGARELADLSIIQNARNRNLLTAESLVNQKIQLETEDLKTRADTLKFFYTENKDSLTKAEQRQFETLTKQADREYNETLAQKKELESTKLSLLKTAAEQGASNQILQAIQSSATPEEAITVAGKYGGDILEKRTKELQLKNLQSEIDKRDRENKPVFLDAEGKIVVDRTEAQKVSKELVSNDAYKAIQKSKDSLLYLKNFEEALNEFGSTSEVFDPIKNSELKAKYNAATLNLKEFFNLGVLNGPDLSIIQGVLPNPSDTSNFRKFVQLGTYQPGTAARSGLNSIKKMVETTLDDRYKSIRTQYSPYSPQSVAALADANRIYIEQKSNLNPNIKKLLDENPDLSDEEILTIMGI